MLPGHTHLVNGNVQRVYIEPAEVEWRTSCGQSIAACKLTQAHEGNGRQSDLNGRDRLHWGPIAGQSY